MSAPDQLPDWPAGTVALLATVNAGAPHAIPVSTAVRAGPHLILLALARSRGSLERLRAEPRCAVTVLATGDVAFTAQGRARIVRESLRCAGSVAAVAVDVEAVRSHGNPRFRVEGGVGWHWTDDDAAARDAQVHAELAGLAGGDHPGTAPGRGGG